MSAAKWQPHDAKMERWAEFLSFNMSFEGNGVAEFEWQATNSQKLMVSAVSRLNAFPYKELLNLKHNNQVLKTIIEMGAIYCGSICL